MDIEKLIERLRNNNIENNCHDCALGYYAFEAATALSTLQTENEEMQKQLNMFSEFLCHMTGGLLSKTNYTAQEMISAAEDYQQKVCWECDLRAENDQLRAELEYEKEHANAYYEECGQWEAENTQLKEKLEALKQDRDAIEQDFRAFAKQWWEEDSGFPCRWCKFERQGGCEWKVKHPGEICAGRAFEWRGQKED